MYSSLVTKAHTKTQSAKCCSGNTRYTDSKDAQEANVKHAKVTMKFASQCTLDQITAKIVNDQHP